MTGITGPRIGRRESAHCFQDLGTVQSSRREGRADRGRPAAAITKIDDRRLGNGPDEFG